MNLDEVAKLEGASLALAAEEGGSTHAVGQPTEVKGWHLAVLGIDLDALVVL